MPGRGRHRRAAGAGERCGRPRPGRRRGAPVPRPDRRAGHVPPACGRPRAPRPQRPRLRHGGGRPVPCDRGRDERRAAARARSHLGAVHRRRLARARGLGRRPARRRGPDRRRPGRRLRRARRLGRRRRRPAGVRPPAARRAHRGGSRPRLGREPRRHLPRVRGGRRIPRPSRTARKRGPSPDRVARSGGTVVGGLDPVVATSARMPGRASHGLGDLLRRLVDEVPEAS